MMSWVRSVTKREEKSTERRGGRELYSLELILYGTSSCPLFGIPLGGHREGVQRGREREARLDLGKRLLSGPKGRRDLSAAVII